MEVNPNMKQTRNKTRKLALAGVVAAAYAALTLLLAPISFSNVQFRVSEVLCILPWFFPCTAQGLFIGCIVANLLNPMGVSVFDVVFGSLATLLAGLCTAALGRKSRSMASSVLGCLMPVLFNAVIVGAVLTWAYRLFMVPDSALLSYAVNAALVGLGELVVLFVLGLPLMRWLPKQPFFQKQIEEFGEEKPLVRTTEKGESS